MNRFYLSILLVLLTASWAWGTDYTYYFDSTDGNDTTGSGSESTPWKSLSKINSTIAGFSSSGNTLTIKLQRGETWTLTSSTGIIVNNSNVTLDAYGSGSRPILDGNNTQPSGLTGGGIPYGYAIKVGDGASAQVTGVYINNLRLQNMYPGGGIIFSGERTGYNGKFVGPGAIRNCELENMGSHYYVP